MYLAWVDNLSSEEDRETFKRYLYSSRPVLERLKQIIEKRERSLDRTEMSMTAYAQPNWGERQAHKNGNREILAELKMLVDIDQQKPGD